MPATLNSLSLDYSLKNALIFATASDLAYTLDSDKIKSVLDAEQVVFLEAAQSIAGFVASSPTDLVIAYRGTVPPTKGFETQKEFFENLGADLQATPRSYHGHQLHKGFFDSGCAVWEGTVAQVRAKGAGKRVWLTGHSLGGAIATLMARWLVEEDVTPVQAAYTIAAPHVGDAGYADSYYTMLPLYRFERGNDIVPWLPPSASSLYHLPGMDMIESLQGINWSPAGQLTYLGTDGSVTTNPTGLEAGYIQTSRMYALYNTLRGGDGTSLFKDHFIESSYIPALETAASAQP